MLAAMTDFKAFGLILVLDWQGKLMLAAMLGFTAFELILFWHHKVQFTSSLTHPFGETTRPSTFLVLITLAVSRVLHAFPQSFGFKGEALSSISDISLLEIVTKTHGMPNGYSKVLKDGKCLYLGFDDCRHENLRNYLIPKAMLSSWVHGDSHKWIGAGN
ncbi:hypothetical protein H5410_064162 [Solanum commersonii]|uniref:Uncharacterized protein n=1 Tax=Solanum commersonii TaxID=4109 RepID=A0A9J5W0A7_SOLCO|nr:hypothetical protein H5410_064162 [Solanum commersonii]